MKVFVYGTLRKGEKNEFHLNDATCLHREACVIGMLYDTNQGYPSMTVDVEDTSEKVYGEIYGVNSDVLEKIDTLEGYVEGRTNNLYERIRTQAVTDNGDILDVITYVSGSRLKHCKEKIPFGDWRVYTYLHQPKLSYFAYGSCMDDERFKKAKVNHYFADVLGKGILYGYSMLFSKSTTNGGKADLVEDVKSNAEGIVYRIPKKAIDYLYTREGVYKNSYRPAIVTVWVRDREHDSLTFIGLDKQPETAPTTLYATEIIRGATEVLSGSYIEQIKDKVSKLTQKANI